MAGILTDRKALAEVIKNVSRSGGKAPIGIRVSTEGAAAATSLSVGSTEVHATYQTGVQDAGLFGRDSIEASFYGAGAEEIGKLAETLRRLPSDKIRVSYSDNYSSGKPALVVTDPALHQHETWRYATPDLEVGFRSSRGGGIGIPLRDWRQASNALTRGAKAFDQKRVEFMPGQAKTLVVGVSGSVVSLRRLPGGGGKPTSVEATALRKASTFFAGASEPVRLLLDGESLTLRTSTRTVIVTAAPPTKSEPLAGFVTEATAAVSEAPFEVPRKALVSAVKVAASGPKDDSVEVEVVDGRLRLTGRLQRAEVPVTGEAGDTGSLGRVFVGELQTALIDRAGEVVKISQHPSFPHLVFADTDGWTALKTF